MLFLPSQQKFFINFFQPFQTLKFNMICQVSFSKSGMNNFFQEVGHMRHGSLSGGPH